MLESILDMVILPTSSQMSRNKLQYRILTNDISSAAELDNMNESRCEKKEQNIYWNIRVIVSNT